MHTFTALYTTRQEAEAVRAQLSQLGVIEGDGVKIGDHSTDGFAPDRNGSSRGFWDSFKDMFVDHADRPVYEESVRQGGFLLMANVDEKYEDRVHDLLERTNALNIDEREQHYRKIGILPFLGAAPPTGGVAAQESSLGQELQRDGRRQTARGGERVRSYVADTLEEELTPVELPRRPS